MNNVTLSSPICQESNSDFIPNVLGFYSYRPNISAIDIFNLLYSFSKKYKSIYMSHETMARLSGNYHKKTVSRELPVLEKFGFIQIFKRGKNKTAEYVINAFFFTAPGRIILIIVFSISFLYVTSPGNVHQLNINNVTKNDFAVPNPKVVVDDYATLNPIFIKNHGYAISTPSTACKYITPTTFQVAPEYYNTSEWAFNLRFEGTPNRKQVPVFLEKLEKRDKQITKKKVAKKMNYKFSFSEIQLDLIKMQPDAVYELALQTYEAHKSAGKIISNPTGYFMALFNKQAALVKQNLKTPKTGYSKPQQQAVAKPVEYVADHEAIRDTLNDRKDKIRMAAEAKGIDIHAGYTLEELRMMLNGYTINPIKRVNSVRMVTNEKPLNQTPFEWCMEVEPRLHQFVIDNNPGLTVTRPYADIMFAKLTPQEQEEVMKFAHPDCECRISVLEVDLEVEVESVTKRPDIMDKQPIVKHSDMAKWAVSVEKKDVAVSEELKAAYGLGESAAIMGMPIESNLPQFEHDPNDYEFTDVEYDNPFPLMEY